MHGCCAAATPAECGVTRRLEARPSSTVCDRILAFVDLETTGLDWRRHEILELAIVLVDFTSLDVIHEFSTRVRPSRLEDADPDALAICGFSIAGWSHAETLRAALLAVAPLLEGTLVAGHNVGFDWAFLEAAYRREGLPVPRVDYHRLDTASLAWPLVVSGEVTSLSLDALASWLGVPRPRPHRALADARCALAVARHVAERMRLGGRVARLAGDERPIFEELLARLELGRTQYGAWRVDDGRDYRIEALEEVLDGLHYVAAELVKQRRDRSGRRQRAYVCHPFADDPVGNVERVRDISQRLVSLGVMPIAPHLFLPQFVDEATERELALELCLELVDTCDEVRVFGGRISAGMQREIDHATRRGIPVRFEREVLA